MDTSSVNTTVTPATSLDPAVQAALDASGYKKGKTASSLTSDDFLKLLTVQLQNQDPLKPMEDAQFMGQMAQFASLEQTRDLNTSFGNFTKQQSIMSAAQFIGMDVTLTAPDGSIVSGIVSKVTIDTDGAKVIVNGTPYATTSVTSVQPPTLVDSNATSN